MPRRKSHNEDVLKCWRSMETFALQDIPDPNRLGPGKKIYALDPNEPLPWEDSEFLHPAEGKRWRHTLYFHIVTKEHVMELLQTFTLRTPDEFRDPVTGYTCFSVIVVDQSGQPNERTYTRSTFPYGIKILRERRDPEELQDLLKASYDDYKKRFGIPEEELAPAKADEEDLEIDDIEEERDEEDEDDLPAEPASQTPPLSWEQLEKELKDLADLIGGKLPPDPEIVCLSEQVSAKAEPEAPFLNSLYLNDLNTIIAHAADLGNPLETYLSKAVNEKDRWDLLDPMALLICIDPRYQPPGRWPANPEHGLYSAQVAALHLAVPYEARRVSGASTARPALERPPFLGRS